MSTSPLEQINAPGNASSAQVPGAQSHPDSNAQPPKNSRVPLSWRLGGAGLIALICLVIWKARVSGAKTETHLPDTMPVAVARVAREDLYNEKLLPAEFRPYLKVELHAKVSGYVDQINVDIGDEVKAGQLLARLEVPELRNELARAKAAEQRAEAEYKDAHLVYGRLGAVDKEHPNLVAQQELDAAEAKDRTTEAAVASAKAEMERDETLLAYTRITAPFDGIITRRYADPGSLIQAGTTSDTQSLPLVCLSDNYRLRLDAAVSVNDIKEIKIGDQVQVIVESLDGKPFTGTITRFSRKVDDDTRTMITEIEVPNPRLELVPGMYCRVAFKFDRRTKALTVPMEAISRGKQPAVWLVNAQHELEERSVTLGLETPDRVEILSGLNEGDLVFVGNRSQIRPGAKVDPVIRSLAQQ
jgi:RND family efflux transporter MFP subunit